MRWIGAFIIGNLLWIGITFVAGIIFANISFEYRSCGDPRSTPETPRRPRD